MKFPRNELKVSSETSLLLLLSVFFSLYTESNTPATLQSMEIKQFWTNENCHFTDYGKSNNFGQMRRKEGRKRKKGQRYLESSLVWSSDHFLDLLSKGRSLFGEEIATTSSRGHHAGTLHVKAWSRCRFEKERKNLCTRSEWVIYRQKFFSACGGQIMTQNLSSVISKNTKGPAPNDHFTFRIKHSNFFSR